MPKKLSEAHRNVSILKIPLYDTNSGARNRCHCLYPIKNFYPQKQPTCHKLMLKGKCFVSQEDGQGKTKNSVVMNLNVSTNDINIFKV